MLTILLFLLVPLLALAQETPPLTWSMQATACQPDDWTLRHLYRSNRDHITLLPGLTTMPRANTWPYTVHCPVTGDGGRRVNQLQIIYKDPDGLGPASRLLVEVRHHLFAVSPNGYPPYYVVLGSFDSNRHLPVPGTNFANRAVLAERAVAGGFGFSSGTYTVVLMLSRSDLDIPPPRVYSVHLGYVP